MCSQSSRDSNVMLTNMNLKIERGDLSPDWITCSRGQKQPRIQHYVRCLRSVFLHVELPGQGAGAEDLEEGAR